MTALCPISKHDRTIRAYLFSMALEFPTRPRAAFRAKTMEDVSFGDFTDLSRRNRPEKLADGHG